MTAPTIGLHGANDTNDPVTANRVRSTVAVTRWFEKRLENSPPKIPGSPG